jgi:hypothetical protein
MNVGQLRNYLTGIEKKQYRLDFLIFRRSL